MTTQTFPRTAGQWVELVRSGPAASQTPALVTLIYRLWLVAFVLKMLGSSWDVSWHFKWLRDDLAPPHLLNTAGTVLVVALVLFQARFNVGVDIWAKRLMIGGTAAFLAAIPIDILNHRLNGLDITAWSPSHAMLYLGTAFMILGAVRGWLLSSEPGPARTVVAAVLWGFFLENVLFPSQHQEYGVLSLADWTAGRPTAEPILLQFAADQIGRPIDRIAVEHFALPVDSWVYPAWVAGIALLTLVAARHYTGFRYTATVIAGGYLAYRMAMWALLVGANFPKSIPPFLVMGGAIVVDLVFLAFAARESRPAVPAQRSGAPSPASRAIMAAVGVAFFGAALATSATAALGWAQDFFIGAPPMYYPAYLGGGLVLFLGWAAITAGPRLVRRTHSA